LDDNERDDNWESTHDVDGWNYEAEMWEDPED